MDKQQAREWLKQSVINRYRNQSDDDLYGLIEQTRKGIAAHSKAEREEARRVIDEIYHELSRRALLGG